MGAGAVVHGELGEGEVWYMRNIIFITCHNLLSVSVLLANPVTSEGS